MFELDNLQGYYIIIDRDDNDTYRTISTSRQEQNDPYRLYDD